MNRIPKEEFNDINEILKIIDNSIDTQNIIDFDFSYIQQGNISNGIINVK